MLKWRAPKDSPGSQPLQTVIICHIALGNITRALFMHEAFILTVIIIAVIWLFLDSLRSQETAIAICKKACEERKVQLLDQTVSVHRVGIRWSTEGIRLRRVYRFDYSDDGENRHTGHLILVGTRQEELSMGLISH